jgi:hypothetical protein
MLNFSCSGSKASDPVIQDMLTSGVIRAPPGDPTDDGPRAAG